MKSNKNTILILVVLFAAAWLFIRHKNNSKSESPVQEIVEEATPQPELTPEVASTATMTPTASQTPTPTATPQVNIDKLRAQAKSQLASAYAAMKSYYFEYGRYSTDLDALGLQQMSPMRFKFGFLREFNPQNRGPYERPAVMNTDKYLGRKITEEDRFKYTAAAEKISLDSLSGYCKRFCTATENEFEIILAYPISDDRFDVWIVNSNKEIELVQDGTK